jgi:hypothetical protein
VIARLVQVRPPGQRAFEMYDRDDEMRPLFG